MYRSAHYCRFVSGPGNPCSITNASLTAILDCQNLQHILVGQAWICGCNFLSRRGQVQSTISLEHAPSNARLADVEYKGSNHIVTSISMFPLPASLRTSNSRHSIHADNRTAVKEMTCIVNTTNYCTSLH